VAHTEHWNRIYREKTDRERSWFQSTATPSLDLITALSPASTDAIIDIGGGEAPLVDELVRRGYTDLTVLDLSDVALAATRQRLGEPGAAVQWIAADVTTWQPLRQYAVWHDRAVFHFLADPAERAAYCERATEGIVSGGHLVMGTFATDGPQQCSALPVVRYSAETLAAEFALTFELVSSSRSVHATPWESEQPFTWVVLRRR